MNWIIGVLVAIVAPNVAMAVPIAFVLGAAWACKSIVETNARFAGVNPRSSREWRRVHGLIGLLLYVALSAALTFGNALALTLEWVLFARAVGVPDDQIVLPATYVYYSSLLVSGCIFWTINDHLVAFAERTGAHLAHRMISQHDAR